MKNQKLTHKEILAQFTIENWNYDLIEGKAINEAEKENIYSLIINQLDSKDAGIRYIASSMVEHFKIQEAKNKLIKRILDVDTLNCTGSMSYALWQLNCQDDLVQIFKILVTQSLETKFHAYNILSEQEFIFTKEDIHEIINIWNRVKENPKSHEIYDDETFEMIKDAYEGFVEYLKE